MENEEIVLLLSLFVLVTATLFTGAALYFNVVEHPARSGLGDAAMLAQWQTSYARALPIQGGLAIVGGGAGLLVWYETGGWQWLAASVVLIANWPFTLSMIMPVNKCLQARVPENIDPDSRSLLDRWARLHAARSALGALSALMFVAALATRLGPANCCLCRSEPSVILGQFFESNRDRTGNRCYSIPATEELCDIPGQQPQEDLALWLDVGNMGRQFIHVDEMARVFIDTQFDRSSSTNMLFQVLGLAGGVSVSSPSTLK